MHTGKYKVKVVLDKLFCHLNIFITWPNTVYSDVL